VKVETATAELEEGVQEKYVTKTMLGSRTAELKKHAYYIYEGSRFWNHKTFRQNIEFPNEL